jgi:hypothetical protein
MPFAVRLMLLLTVLTMTAGAVPPPHESLGALLTRMRAYYGPVWDAHLTSVSQLTENGVAVTFKNESQGLRFVSSQCDGALCQGTYFDGERLWSIDVNGTTLPQTDGFDPLLRAERTVASLSFLAPDFTMQGGRVVDDGFTNISGELFRTLLIANGDAIPMLIYVDPKTASVRYMRDVNGDMTLEYRDYATVALRYHLPLSVLRNGALFEHYETRGAVSTAFDPPHGLVATFAGSAPAVVTTDPQHSTPVFPCTLAGVATTCLLDTGNSGLSISLALAEQLNAQSVGSFKVRGLGDYATEVVQAGALQVGTMTLPAAKYVVLNDIDKFGYSVVLGADLLGATTVQIDHVSHSITFGAPAPKNAASVPLSFDNFVPVLDVRLGETPAQLALDTGDESSINLAYDFYEAHPGLFSLTGERTVSGVGGSSTELLGTIPSVQIGDLTIPSAIIGTTRNLHGTALGHLGAGFLASYDVTIDYANGALYLLPTANR